MKENFQHNVKGQASTTGNAVGLKQKPNGPTKENDSERVVGCPAPPCSADVFLGGGGVVIEDQDGLKRAQNLLETCVAMYGVPIRLSLSVYQHKT